MTALLIIAAIVLLALLGAQAWYVLRGTRQHGLLGAWRTLEQQNAAELSPALYRLHHTTSKEG